MKSDMIAMIAVALLGLLALLWLTEERVTNLAKLDRIEMRERHDALVRDYIGR